VGRALEARDVDEAEVVPFELERPGARTEDLDHARPRRL
jgi:hypothetical protein